MSFLSKTLICASLALLGSQAAMADTLKIGTEGGYPPWSMVDAAGKVTGFDADVGAALCKELNSDCKFIVQAFDSLIPSLDAKRFDLIISGMSYTPERAKRVNFSIPYAVEDAIFVLPKNSDLVGADNEQAIFDGLAGKTNDLPISPNRSLQGHFAEGDLVAGLDLVADAGFGELAGDGVGDAADVRGVELLADARPWRQVDVGGEDIEPGADGAPGGRSFGDRHGCISLGVRIARCRHCMPEPKTRTREPHGISARKRLGRP